MDKFIEFCVDTLIGCVGKCGQTQTMIETLRTCNEEQISMRVMAVMDELEMDYIITRQTPLFVHSRQENCLAVARELRRRLGAQLASSQAS